MSRTRKNSIFCMKIKRGSLPLQSFAHIIITNIFSHKTFPLSVFVVFFRILLFDWHWYLKPLKGFYYALVETKDHLKRSTWWISLITFTTQLDSLLFKFYLERHHSFMMVNVKSLKFSSFSLLYKNFNLSFDIFQKDQTRTVFL